MKRFLTKSKLKLTATPKRRKGRRRSQMIGYKIRAAIANGQQTMNRKIQSRKVSMVVEFGFFGSNCIPSKKIYDSASERWLFD